MSMFKSAITSLSGTVVVVAKYALPQSPAPPRHGS